MKLHWGHSIAIFIIIFVITGISIMVNIISNDDASHQLVSEKYYEEELDFQKNKNKILRGKAIANKIEVSQLGGKEINIKIDSSLNIKKGDIKFYCPFDKYRDFKTAILNNNQSIRNDKITKGLWRLNIYLTDNTGVDFIIKKPLQIK